MSESKSFVARLFGWFWQLLVGIYRLIVVVSVLISLFLVWTSFQGGPPAHVENNEPLVLIPTGTIVDQLDQSSRNFLHQLTRERPSQTLLRDLTDALEAGAKDSRIPFAVVRLDEMTGAGLAQLQELAVAMKKFRAAGKPIYAFGESFDQTQYFIAAQADEVSLDPMGLVLLEGYSTYTNYFKDALDKLGVQVNVFRVGEFKSAVEPFLRNDMSPEAKLENQAWLSDLWGSFNSGISQPRGLPENSADTYARGFADALVKDKGDGAALALQAKLVTRLETQADFRKRMAVKVGFDKDKATFRQIDFATYLRAVGHGSKKKPSSHKIALVVVEGEIVEGDSDQNNAGGDTISDLLDQARHDDDVEAVLLRVNSPGGSVFASEKIRRAVQALQKDGKPVVVSMSTLAASGGYWISMEADKIFAEPSTITGSIGIFGLVPTIDQPLNKLGIHTDGVGTTPLSGAFRVDRPLTTELRAIMQAQIEKGYRDFTGGVAKARNLPIDKVEAIARGRVWSGAAAKGLGLVDELGSLEDAQAALAKLAKLQPGDFELDEMEPQHDWFKSLFGRFLSQSSISVDALRLLLPAGPLREQAQSVGQTLQRLNDPAGEYAYCFCEPAATSGLIR